MNIQTCEHSIVKHMNIALSSMNERLPKFNRFKIHLDQKATYPAITNHTNNSNISCIELATMRRQRR